MLSGRSQSLLTLAGAVGTAWMLGCMNPTDSSQNNGSLAMSQAGDTDSAGNKGGAGKTTICHIPPGNPANAHTISVGNPAVPAHLAHGDKLGACTDVSRKPKPCSDGSAEGSSHDGLAPALDGGKVAVCHIPPGNPANMHTIVVGAAAVKAHLAHGDKLGACTAETVPNPISVDCGGGNDGGAPHGHNPHDGGTDNGGTNDGGSTGGSNNGGSTGGDSTSTSDTTSSNY